MTPRTLQTVPEDFAIQVAEKEGMPSKPNPEGSVLHIARPRRLMGTFTFGQSMKRAAAGVLWSTKEAIVINRRKPAKRSPIRLLTKLAVAAGMMAFLAFPLFAQNGTGPLPENAVERSCVRG